MRTKENKTKFRPIVRTGGGGGGVLIGIITIF